MANAAFSLYALGFVVMLAPLLSDRLNGWVAFAVFLGGVAVFSVGIVLEGRTVRR